MNNFAFFNQYENTAEQACAAQVAYWYENTNRIEGLSQGGGKFTAWENKNKFLTDPETKKSGVFCFVLYEFNVGVAERLGDGLQIRTEEFKSLHPLQVWAFVASQLYTYGC